MEQAPTIIDYATSHESRPLGIKIIAWSSIIFAGIGLYNCADRLARYDPARTPAWALALWVLDMVPCIVLLYSGFGGLRYSAWARKAMIWSAAACIAMALAFVATGF